MSVGYAAWGSTSGPDGFVYDANDLTEGGRYAREQNRVAWQGRIPVFNCPSDLPNNFYIGGPGTSWPKQSYLACGGSTAIGYTPNQFTWAPDYWAMQIGGGDPNDVVKGGMGLFGMLTGIGSTAESRRKAMSGTNGMVPMQRPPTELPIRSRSLKRSKLSATLGIARTTPTSAAASTEATARSLPATMSRIRTSPTSL